MKKDLKSQKHAKRKKGEETPGGEKDFPGKRRVLHKQPRVKLERQGTMGKKREKKHGHDSHVVQPFSGEISSQTKIFFK